MNNLSIIVPIYNAEKYLNKCIESILNQNYADFELILVDDGSTDSSGKICEKFKKTDSRIHVLHQKNAGPASARNMGISISKGKYIGFCDSDDILRPNYYKCLVDNIEKENADISGVSFESVNEKGIISHNKQDNNTYIWNNEEGFKAFLIRDKLDIHVWTKLYRKAFLDKYDIKYEVRKGVKIEEDFLFNLKAFLHSKKTVFENINLYTYLCKETSLSRDYHKCHFRIYLHYSLYRLYKVEKTTEHFFPNLLHFAKRQTILYMVQTLARCTQVKYKNCEPYYSYVMRYIRRNKKQVIEERAYWGMSIIGVLLMTNLPPIKYHFYRKIKNKLFS